MKLEGEYKKRAARHVETKQKAPPEVVFDLSKVRQAEDWLAEAEPEFFPRNQAPRPKRTEVRARLDRAASALRAWKYDRTAKKPEPPPELGLALEFLQTEYPHIFTTDKKQRNIDLSQIKDNLDLLPDDIQRAVRQLDTYLTCRGEESLETQEFKAAREPLVREHERRSFEFAKEYYAAQGILTSSFVEGQNPEDAEVREEIKQLEKTCQDIADKLVSSAGVLKHLKPKVIIRSDTSTNAHVLTAGKERLLEQLVNDPPPEEPIELPVYINFGLIQDWIKNQQTPTYTYEYPQQKQERLERHSPDSLAAVLAHELSHLLQPNAFAEYAEASDQQRLEYDADLNAMRLLDRAGFNPRAMLRVLEKFPTDAWQHLWQAAGASHPPTEERRKALLKEFNRSDTVYANAGKAYQTFSAEDVAALAAIQKIHEQREARDNQEQKQLKDCWSLKTLTGEKTGLSSYRRIDARLKNITDNIQQAEQAVDEYTRHIVIAQELDRDERGLRSQMLLSLCAIQEALKKFPADKLTIQLRSSSYDSQYEKELLKTAYADPAESVAADQQRTTDFVKELELKIGRPLDPKQYQDLDYWLSDNPETKPVWERLENKDMPLTTPEERRNFIGGLLIFYLKNLRSFTHERQLSIKYTTIKEGTERRPKQSAVSAPKESASLDSTSTLSRLLENAPLARTRLHRQQQIEAPPPSVEQEMEEVTIQYETTETWLLKDVGQRIYNLNWLKQKPGEPPPYQEIRQAVHQQVRTALRRELSDRGIFASDKTLVFLANLSIVCSDDSNENYPFKKEELDLTSLLPSDLDWAELAVAKLTLDKFNFAGSYLPHGQSYNNHFPQQTYNKVWSVITYLLTTVWRPQIPAEIELQESLLQKTRLHPAYEPPGQRVSSVVLKNQDGETSIPVNSGLLRLQAFNNLLWQKERDRLLDAPMETAAEIQTGPLMDRLRDQWFLAQALTRRGETGRGLTELLQYLTPEQVLPVIIKSIVQATRLRDQALTNAMNPDEAKGTISSYYTNNPRDHKVEPGEKTPIKEKTTRLLDPLLWQTADSLLQQVGDRGAAFSQDSRQELVEDLGFLAQVYDPPDHVWKIRRLAQTLPFSPKVKQGWLEDLAGKGVEMAKHEALYLPLLTEKLEYTSPEEWRRLFAEEMDPIPLSRLAKVLQNEALGRFINDAPETAERQQAQKKIIDILNSLKAEDLGVSELALLWGQLPLFRKLKLEFNSHSRLLGLVKNKRSWAVEEYRDERAVRRQLFEFYKSLGIYHQKRWQDLPAFKRWDEWLSHLEWNEFNPLFAAEPQLQKLLDDLQIRINPDGFNSTLSLGSYLDQAYQFDTQDFGLQNFSWALLLRDFLDPTRSRDALIAEVIKLAQNKHSNRQPEEKKYDLEELARILRGLYATLHEIVSRPDIEPVLKAMHNGPFKEALLAASLARRQLPLEQLENYNKEFKRPYHESVVANKTEAFIQLQTNDILKEAGTKVLFDIMKRRGLADANWTVEYNYNHLEITKLNFYTPGNKVLNEQENQAFKKTQDQVPEIIQEYKQVMQARYQECLDEQIKWTPENQVKMFSDLVAEDGQTTLQAEPAHWYRLVLSELTETQSQFLAAQNLEAAETQIKKLLPEASPLKDLFLENVLIHKVAALLSTAEQAVAPERSEVDLTSLFPHDQTAIKKMFWQKYPVYEIPDLAQKLEQAPEGARWRVMRTVRLALAEMSPVGQQKYGRLLTSLESQTLWPQLRRAAQKNPELFERYLNIIKKRYPEASFERDQILENIGLELAETPEQIREIWALRYEQVTRWPNPEETAREKKKYEGFERLKSYLAVQEPDRKSELLLWLLGGPMPPAEAFASQHFKVDASSRVDAFWHFTPAERRHIFYAVLLGDQGLVETQQIYSDFVNKLYEQNLASLQVNPDLPAEHPDNKRGQKVLSLTFTQLLKLYENPARRAELLITVSETLAAQREKRIKSAGGMIKVLLEQLGVIGIKIGQVLSEQPGLLPPALQQDLSYLKDRAAPFNKYGVLNYAEAGETKHEAIARVQECVGSASIKQVHRAVTVNGHEVALKVKRPSIDKNFEEDLTVLRKILSQLQQIVSVPSHLLSEVEKSARTELEFGIEAQNQTNLGERLKKREVVLPLQFGEQTESWPLETTPVHFPVQTPDMGLMIEDFVEGLSLKNVKDYQTALAAKDETTLKTWRQKLRTLYGETAPEIEKKINKLDTDRLQASIAQDLLQQITSDGLFHADPHSGNILLDFRPGQERAVYIDLGSVGRSYREDGEDYRQDFADFISLFSAQEIDKSAVAKLLEKFTSLPWDDQELEPLLAADQDTAARAKKIFYTILEKVGGYNDSLNQEFRYLLKTLATGAEHFDKLKQQMVVA